jgi:hypothetical protein
LIYTEAFQVVSVSVPEALYGMFVRDYQNNLVVNPCPGLKHVYFVQHSMFWPLKVGEINSSVGLRPAVGEGVTQGQKTFKADMVDMTECVRNEIYYPGIGSEGYGKWETNWTGENKPTFSFVSLAPKIGLDKRVYDVVEVKAALSRSIAPVNAAP